jgi:hypothetical protein
MTGPTHVIIATVATLVLRQQTDFAPTDLLAWVVMWTGALLPDIDEPSSTITEPLDVVDQRSRRPSQGRKSSAASRARRSRSRRTAPSPAASALTALAAPRAVAGTVARGLPGGRAPPRRSHRRSACRAGSFAGRC